MVRRWLPSGRATGSHQRCALRKRTTREMWLYLVRTQNGSGVFSVRPYVYLTIFGRKPPILKIVSFIDLQILYTMPPLCRGVQSKTIRARRATSLSARTEVVPQICLSKCLIHPSSIPSTLRKLRRNRLFKSYKLRNRRVSVATQLQRVLVEVIDAARAGRGAEQAIAAYSDIRQSKQYPRLRAGVECHICISRPSGYRVVCNAQRGDQEMGRCSIEVQDYGRAKAHLLAWIQIGERWIGDTWSEPPSSALPFSGPCGE